MDHFQVAVRGRQVWWDFGAQGVARIGWADQAVSDWKAERSSWAHQDRDVIHLMAQDWINTLLDVARRQGWPCVDFSHATTVEVLIKCVESGWILNWKSEMKPEPKEKRLQRLTGSKETWEQRAGMGWGWEGVVVLYLSLEHVRPTCCWLRQIWTDVLIQTGSLQQNSGHSGRH